MRRREFIAGTAALLVSPRRSWAQGPPRRVGYLDTAPLYLPNFKVWQDSLRDHGWIEGKNLIVECWIRVHRAATPDAQSVTYITAGRAAFTDMELRICPHWGALAQPLKDLS